MKLKFRFILMFVALCMCSASLALGASVTIVPSGAGSFIVQGDNMNGVAGIDLTIGYDTSTLNGPTVTLGSLASGGFPAFNTTVPGSIRIAIIQTTPLSGSGPIVAITFATHTGSGGITSVSAKIIDSKNVLVPTQASIAPGATGTATADPGLITTAGVPFTQSETTRPPATVTTTTPSPTVSAGLGTVSMPGDNQPKSDVQPAESKTAQPVEPVEVAEATTQQMNQPAVEKKADKVESVEIKQTVYGSVLDRFRTYQGEKTPETMIALFTKAVSPTIHQVPAVAICDGKATVRVTVDLAAIKGTSTNFALTGAKMVSLKKEDGSGSWVLDALPQMNTLKATVTILSSGSVIEFPLTVVPPVAGVSTKQADFAAFLKDSGAKVPKHDLNSDGRHDYLDDFIYTANYLLKSSIAAKDTK